MTKNMIDLLELIIIKGAYIIEVIEIYTFVIKWVGGRALLCSFIRLFLSSLYTFSHLYSICIYFCSHDETRYDR